MKLPESWDPSPCLKRHLAGIANCAQCHFVTVNLINNRATWLHYRKHTKWSWSNQITRQKLYLGTNGSDRKSGSHIWRGMNPSEMFCRLMAIDQSDPAPLFHLFADIGSGHHSHSQLPYVHHPSLLWRLKRENARIKSLFVSKCYFQKLFVKESKPRLIPRGKSKVAWAPLLLFAFWEELTPFLIEFCLKFPSLPWLVLFWSFSLQHPPLRIQHPSFLGEGPWQLKTWQNKLITS